ncbi:unnamed protein product [Ilex paraguariensis]|uniref:RRM domain-containing protein n=1 Tax=Ilex paraguariensis TaxID=185542 RepID=A0ABC8U7G0_9AQUA
MDSAPEMISDYLLKNGELSYIHMLTFAFPNLDMFLVCLHQSFRRPKSLPWQPGLFEDSLRAAGLPGLEIGTKLYVSNLDIGVTNEDIRELFSEIGELKRYAIHYDKNGRPSVSFKA